MYNQIELNEISNQEISTFRHLPDLVVQDIFSNLDEKVRQRNRCICNYWNLIVGQYFEKTLPINNINWKNIIQTQGHKLHILFQNFDIPIFNIMNDNQSFASRIKSITFSGYLVCHNVIPVLQECFNLQTLEFVNFNIHTFFKEIPIDLEMDSNKLLPALKHLEIIFEENINFTNFGKLETKIKFCKILFPFFINKELNGKLESVTLGSRMEIPDASSICSIVPNSDNPQPEIQAGGLSNYRIVKNFFENLLQKCKHSLREITLYELMESRINNNIINGHKIYIRIKFTEQHVFVSKFVYKKYDKGLIYNSNSSSINSWLNFMNFNRELKIFHCSMNIPNYGHIIASILKKNMKTLKKIKLINIVKHFISFNVLEFHQFENLQELIVEREALPPLLYDIDINNFNIINIQCLSTTIRILKLSATIQVDTKSNICGKIFKNLLNLEEFEFTARPWLRYHNENNEDSDDCLWTMKSIDIQNIIKCLTRLKNFKLKNHLVVPEYTMDSNQCGHSIPMTSLTWIDSTPGIYCQNVLTTTGTTGFIPIPHDYIVNIIIEKEFRNNRQQSNI